MPGAAVRFACFDIGSVPGGLMEEMAGAMEPEATATMTLIADAARGWDGSEPVRDLALPG